MLYCCNDVIGHLDIFWDIYKFRFMEVKRYCFQCLKSRYVSVSNDAGTLRFAPDKVCLKCSETGQTMAKHQQKENCPYASPIHHRYVTDGSTSN